MENGKSATFAMAVCEFEFGERPSYKDEDEVNWLSVGALLPVDPDQVRRSVAEVEAHEPASCWCAAAGDLGTWDPHSPN